MYETLNDLRILKLALAVEDTFEIYEASLLELVKQPHLDELLRPLFEDGPAHKKLRENHERLQRTLDENETPDQMVALQVMLECERSARDLYLRYLDRVKDPAIVEVLRGLAAEEEEHARIVQRAIGILKDVASA